MLVTPKERCLIAAYYEARNGYVDAARWEREQTAEGWAERIGAAEGPFRQAERELIEDIISNGDVETGPHRYSVCWVHELREFRLKITRFEFAPAGRRGAERAA